jgi:hypothetical protein
MLNSKSKLIRSILLIISILFIISGCDILMVDIIDNSRESRSLIYGFDQDSYFPIIHPEFLEICT